MGSEKLFRELLILTDTFVLKDFLFSDLYFWLLWALSVCFGVGGGGVESFYGFTHID